MSIEMEQISDFFFFYKMNIYKHIASEKRFVLVIYSLKFFNLTYIKVRNGQDMNTVRTLWQHQY